MVRPKQTIIKPKLFKMRLLTMFDQDNQPLYKQVKDIIKNKIKASDFKQGEKIPPERELSNILDVSRYCVRRAIQELEKEGYLYRIQGNGTFISEKQANGFKNKHIGVIMAHYKEEFQLKILRGIGKRLQEDDYKMTLLDTDNDFQKECQYINKLVADEVSGLIIMPTENREDNKIISGLAAAEFPLVLVDSKLEDCETDCVLSKNIEGAYKAANYLIKMGHEKIGFVKYDIETSSISNRIVGYKKALHENEINYNSNMIVSFDKNSAREQIESKIYKFIKEQQPTAVIGVNDVVALDIVKICRKQDIEIPEDLSVIGFADIESNKHIETPLTSVAQFPDEIGYCAASLLLKRLSGDNEENNNTLKNSITEQIFYPVKLIARDSCRAVDFSDS